MVHFEEYIDANCHSPRLNKIELVQLENVGVFLANRAKEFKWLKMRKKLPCVCNAICFCLSEMSSINGNRKSSLGSFLVSCLDIHETIV